MKKLLTVIGAVLILMLSFSNAQETSGGLAGVVADEEGIPLPGVTIEAVSPNMMGKATAVTNEMGRFRLTNLSPGTYTVTFSLPGFNTLKRQGIIVRVGSTFDLRETLQTATLEEEITVIGESPMVDIKKSGTTYEISKETD